LSKDELIKMVMSMAASKSKGTEDDFTDLKTPADNKIFLDGETLTPEELVLIGYNTDIEVELSPSAWAAVERSRKVVDNIVARGDFVCYGVNTGFGNFANVIIPHDQICALQENLIRSHAAGVGAPLPNPSVRMLLALRINVLAKGHSGIRPESLRTMLLALRHNCLSRIPLQGTVGASGDLAPLSHLALGLMGEGKMFDPTTGDFADASAVLAKFSIPPLQLHAKEGLACINGTQFIVALGAEAVVRAKRIARQADVVAALTVETLKGSATAFHPYIHHARPHRGQGLVAGRVRNLLGWNSERSELAESHKHCNKVQDSYSLRCVPQIHGVAHETIQFVYKILLTEMNSATDNPMVFPYADPEDVASLPQAKQDAVERTIAKFSEQKRLMLRGEKPVAAPVAADAAGRVAAETVDYALHDGVLLSGGNFHGQYPAHALDVLAIAVHELASVSERRIERLVNPVLSGLPSFLTAHGGLNSGMMIPHCTAAALVSENKVLCHPASVDSQSTSAAQEDHVSMGGFSARKAVTVVKHTEQVLAIELLCSAQALDFHRPLKTTAPLERVHALVRTVVEPWTKDRFVSPDIEAVWALLHEDKVWDAVKQDVETKFHHYIPLHKEVMKQ
jgi:histidine ammonia-lyase